MTVLVFQNYPCEDAALLGEALESFGAELRVVDCFAGEPPPSPSWGSALLILGGPMNVYEEEEYPFLAWETRWIREWVAAGRPALGLCLGAQLIAKAMGARVVKSPVKEIGHFSVELTGAGAGDPVFAGFPNRIPVVQWHEDTFELPRSAVQLARGRLCENQAFRMGSAVGLQFHLELGRAKLEQWFREYDIDGEDEGVDVPAVLSEFAVKEPVYRDLCRRFVENFWRSLSDPASAR